MDEEIILQLFVQDGVQMVRAPDGRVFTKAEVERYNNPGMDFDDVTGEPLMMMPTISDTPTTTPSRSLGSRVGNEDIDAGLAMMTDADASLYNLLDPSGRYSNTLLGRVNRAALSPLDILLGGLTAGSGALSKGMGYASDALGLGLQPGDIPDAEEMGQLADALYALPASRMLGAASEAGGRAAAARAVVDRLNQPGPVPTMGSNFGNLPPLSNAQRTQIAGTLPTYQKAADILGTSGPGLDYGAGLGLGARELGFDAFEPFPREGFIPTYTDPAAIPSQAYDRLTNFNVLNVVPREVRDDIVENIGRVIAPGGRGLITTRGRDVLAAKGTPGPEPMSLITSRDTYQKGFLQQELQDYLRYILGSDFEVSPLRLGPAGAEIRRVASAPRTRTAANADKSTGLLAAAAAETPTGIRAYHGSPHDFDRFSMDAIGTGEGAQAYGHGLYFAEAEPVARGYRDQLSQGNTAAARRTLEAAGGDVNKAISETEAKLRRLDERAAAGDFGGDERRFAAQRQIQQDKISQLRGFKETGEFNAGRMYEVNISANPEDFLDWDKTGPEQSESVRKALTSIASKDPQIMQAFKDAMQRGDKGAIYESLLQDRLGSVRLNQEGAARRLREAGIPGIRYLDAMSRNAGEGSRNFVVFDENLINIVRKYGIAGAAAVLGVSVADVEAAMAQGQQPSRPQGLLGVQ